MFNHAAGRYYVFENSFELTANVRTEGVAKNFVFWDVFKEFLIAQRALR
jgi:hypothetical protein